LDLSRLIDYNGWQLAYASTVVWGVLFVLYTQFSLWKKKRSRSS